MLALVIFGLRLLRFAVYAEAAVIVVLGLLCIWLFARAVYLVGQYDQALAERDEARATLKAIGRMSEIRVETVARMRGFR